MEREDVRKARGMKAWSVASLATWLLGFENHMGPRWEGGDPPQKTLTSGVLPGKLQVKSRDLGLGYLWDPFPCPVIV